MDNQLEVKGIMHQGSPDMTVDQMFDMAEKESPFGDCAICDAKNVKVGTLQNLEDPTRTMQACFKCLRGNLKMSESQKN